MLERPYQLHNTETVHTQLQSDTPPLLTTLWSGFQNPNTVTCTLQLKHQMLSGTRANTFDLSALEADARGSLCVQGLVWSTKSSRAARAVNCFNKQTNKCFPPSPTVRFSWLHNPLFCKCITQHPDLASHKSFLRSAVTPTGAPKKAGNKWPNG